MLSYTKKIKTIKYQYMFFLDSMLKLFISQNMIIGLKCCFGCQNGPFSPIQNLSCPVPPRLISISENMSSDPNLKQKLDLIYFIKNE